MLNEQQEQVVKHSGKSLVNIAGPGSGKTHTLIEKINNIVLTEGVEVTNKLLVLTFTNAAAEEIKYRALSKIQGIRGNLYFGTYHSTFRKLLQEYDMFEYLGYGEKPTIINPNDILRIGANILKDEVEINFGHIKESILLSYYTKKDKKPPKNPQITKTIVQTEIIDIKKLVTIFEDNINYLTKQNILEYKNIGNVYRLITQRVIEEISSELEKNLKKLYARVEEGQTDLNYPYTKTFGASIYREIMTGRITKEEVLSLAADTLNILNTQKIMQSEITFSDIMLLTLLCLVQNEEFTQKLKEYFKYIFVDEFQDTNIIQSEILNLLQNGNNTCVIGDPYQSIYGFLGGQVENILNAKETFNADTIQLVYNYRSNKNIVELTNYIGQNMVEKIENWKPCKSANKDVQNNKIVLVENISDEPTADQSKYIVDKINKLPFNKTIGIISRKGTTYKLEQELTKARIDYKKLGGLSILESPEIKLMILLFVYVYNENKHFALNEILNSCVGIGEKTIEKYLNDVVKDKKAKAPKKIQEIINKLETIKIEGSSKDKDKFDQEKDKILEFYNELVLPKLSSQWKTNRIEQAKMKIEVLFAEIKDAESQKELTTLLEEYMLGEKKQESKEESNVVVTTIHSAKGLEWDEVFLIDWTEDTFKRDEDTEAQRLAYVAVSRAREKLTILSPTKEFFEIKQDFIENNEHLFEYQKNEIKIDFGKYSGKTYDEIKTIEQSYITYLQNQYYTMPDYTYPQKQNKEKLRKFLGL